KRQDRRSDQRPPVPRTPPGGPRHCPAGPRRVPPNRTGRAIGARNAGTPRGVRLEAEEFLRVSLGRTDQPLGRPGSSDGRMSSNVLAVTARRISLLSVATL